MDESTVAVGRITRAHGVQGELAVLVISEVPGRFADGETVWLEDGRTLTVESSRPHKDRLLVRFREVQTREQAEALQRALLVVPESLSPELPEGSWWDHWIVGCAIETDTRRALGRERRLVGRRRRGHRDADPRTPGRGTGRGHGREADRRPRDPRPHDAGVMRRPGPIPSR